MPFLEVPQDYLMPEDDIDIQAQPPLSGLKDFPALRDLETSLVFSGVNHNFNI